MPEYVVLVDDNNKPIGKADKASVHNAKTPLHRAFSLFLFNNKGRLLLQQRSAKKKTFPTIWSNSCCGHPFPKESYTNAIKRRLNKELGIINIKLIKLLPKFRYTAEANGILENEICPVYIGFSDDKIIINPEEVENYQWIIWKEFIKRVENNDPLLSVWSKLETQQLLKSKKFRMLYKQYN